MQIKKLLLLTSLFLFLGSIIFIGSFALPPKSLSNHGTNNFFTDVSRLNPQIVEQVVSVTSTEQLQQIVREANKSGKKISIAGSRHSQGGQVYSKGSIVLAMRSFNRILEINPKNKTIRVESGATWDEIQQALNPLGLAIKVMQSSYIFTVGGTLSANAHGRDLEKTSIVETVRSFRFLTAKGDILDVSRQSQPELFRLVVGGYGLFGVIVDVTLEVTDNDVLERTAKIVDYRDFPTEFESYIKKNPNVSLLLARPSIASDTFMQEIVLTQWNKHAGVPAEVIPLGQEEHVSRDRFLFNLSRTFQWGKNLRWKLQKGFESSPGKTVITSRNNAMRPPATPLKFLDYFSEKQTDIIQEYYVPTRHFVPFMEEFRQILLGSGMNVISSTIRYVKANDEVDLAYCPKENCFAIIQMSNVGLSDSEQEKARLTTQKLVDSAIKYEGSYYLTYQLYPTVQQLSRAYPRASAVFRAKLKWDPKETFTSLFYEHYKEVAQP
ncbi:MAG: FAD-binding oxidoreductase [Proteobacteria bacterium]|nr:FAD-binding oxidoreductase [Pseudomonadota bacterium]NDC24734.1 FAD-binding oxidoreductase [Pseudomonadota bacterium]NDD03407.1 FAD-binding oxidoreductase [Pseudomonadota bacterium]NDG27175.1 FAD-binding oxidoreductase [Pseudomonadota bacterium]